jgi:ATP-binding cassette subfamily B multidrug efflux pump
MRHLTHYLGGHKWMFLLVALLVLISTGANILGTYLLKPVINRFILPGDVKGLLTAVAGMGILYLCGVAATLATISLW